MNYIDDVIHNIRHKAIVSAYSRGVFPDFETIDEPEIFKMDWDVLDALKEYENKLNGAASSLTDEGLQKLWSSIPDDFVLKRKIENESDKSKRNIDFQTLIFNYHWYQEAEKVFQNEVKCIERETKFNLETG